MLLATAAGRPRDHRQRQWQCTGYRRGRRRADHEFLRAGDGQRCQRQPRCRQFEPKGGIEDSNGAIQASAIHSSANARTSFGAVLLDGVAGAVDVENQNGGVDVSLLGQQCRSVVIRTSFSAVRVRVPDNASYTVAAKTSFGKIRMDLPLTVSGEVRADSLSGTIGGGSCVMRLNNHNGGIQILKGGRS